MSQLENIIIPGALKKGDTIGIVAPAAQLVDRDSFSAGITILQEMGFEVKYPRNLWPGYSYLADSDENRAFEFNKMWADPEVKALMTVRGGYGCLRMVSQIDHSIIRASPKMLIGFSDITILNNLLFNNYNMASLHGPVLTSLATCSRGALERFYLSITGKWNNSINPTKFEVLRNSERPYTGPLVGGNLSTIITMLGTELEPDFRNKTLFIEDVGEPQYRIDRMLTQMNLAGKFKDLAGLIVGDFSHQNCQDGIESMRYKEFIWNRVLEMTYGTDYPIISNFPTGHCRDNFTLPFGVTAKINIDKKRLDFVS